MEYIMERISFEMNLDPLDFRMKNLLKKGDRLIKAYGTLAEENPIPKMVHSLKQSANYLERKKKVDEFNQVSRHEPYTKMQLQLMLSFNYCMIH